MPDQRLEAMRNLALELEFGASGVGSGNGCFMIRHRGVVLRMVASESGDGWDHVSVTVNVERCPTWEEMCFVKDLFFLPEETVMQLHPSESTWVSNHRYCLHLWRPLDCAIPLPPSIMVGIKEEGEFRTRDEAMAARERYLKRETAP